jgi:hypothetical protein
MFLPSAVEVFETIPLPPLEKQNRNASGSSGSSSSLNSEHSNTSSTDYPKRISTSTTIGVRGSPSSSASNPPSYSSPSPLISPNTSPSNSNAPYPDQQQLTSNSIGWVPSIVRHSKPEEPSPAAVAGSSSTQMYYLSSPLQNRRKITNSEPIPVDSTSISTQAVIDETTNANAPNTSAGTTSEETTVENKKKPAAIIIDVAGKCAVFRWSPIFKNWETIDEIASIVIIHSEEENPTAATAIQYRVVAYSLDCRVRFVINSNEWH